jgi:hypothetical protein
MTKSDLTDEVGSFAPICRNYRMSRRLYDGSRLHREKTFKTALGSERSIAARWLRTSDHWPMSSQRKAFVGS